MFSLISGLWHYLFSPQNFHILIIGIDSAGKTTLLENIKRNYGAGGLPASKITPTIGMNLAKIRYKGAQVIFWDLGGQSKMRAMWEKYYLEADAVVYVVDSANPARLDEAKRAFDVMLEDSSLSETPIFVLANKQDVEGALSPDDLAATAFGNCGDNSGVALSSGCGHGTFRNVFGVSAVTSTGLDSCLSALVRECRLHKNHS